LGYDFLTDLWQKIMRGGSSQCAATRKSLLRQYLITVDMITEIAFYHLTTLPLERALPRLLEKILQVKKRAIILCTSEDRLNYLNGALWTLGKLSFIPHGSAKEGYEEDQPIWLTTKDENPNGAQFLILTEGAEAPTLSTYERCLDLFDGNDEEAIAQARKRWTSYKNQGYTVTYWKQTESGSWEKGA